MPEKARYFVNELAEKEAEAGQQQQQQQRKKLKLRKTEAGGDRGVGGDRGEYGEGANDGKKKMTSGPP